jgi:hypothetical protein
MLGSIVADGLCIKGMHSAAQSHLDCNFCNAAAALGIYMRLSRIDGASRTRNPTTHNATSDYSTDNNKVTRTEQSTVLSCTTKH